MKISIKSWIVKSDFLSTVIPCKSHFLSLFIATVLFLRLDIILICCACIGTTWTLFISSKPSCSTVKSESNSQYNQLYKANAISYILQTSPFPEMINLYIWKNILGLPSDEHILYLSVLLKLSCWWLPVFLLLAEL